MIAPTAGQKLTRFNETILEIAEGARDNSEDKAANDYAAACAIKDWMSEKDCKCSLDQAYTYLVNARMSEAALS